MKTNKLLVSTTPALEGWKIETYLGPVSAHIVTGTDLFTDIFASFSDFFGGRSQAYQRELARINDEAIEQLRLKASAIGANCIIGLRIDHDEISGKGKQMFMVTALGTAVRAVQSSSEKVQDARDYTVISKDDLDAHLKKKQIVQDFKGGKLMMDDKTWEYVTQNRVHEIVHGILVAAGPNYQQRYDSDKYKQFLIRTKQYLSALSPDVVKPALYNAVKKKGAVAEFAIEIISELNLFDPAAVRDLLMSEEFEVRKLALRLLAADKTYYKMEDVKSMEELLPLIETNFPVRVEWSTEKAGMLSSKTKEVWRCECGGKSEADISRCFTCGRNIYGFKESEITPAQAKSILSDKIIALKEQFGN